MEVTYLVVTESEVYAYPDYSRAFGAYSNIESAAKLFMALPNCEKPVFMFEKKGK